MSSSRTSLDSRVRILQLLLSEGSCTRPALAAQTGLTRAAVGVVAEELMERGIIREGGREESRGGRRARLLEIVPEAAVAVGASMRDSDWSFAAADLHGEILDEDREPMAATDPSSAIQALVAGYNRFTERLGGKTLLPALGVGTPGLVDIHRGHVQSAVDLGWNEVPFARMGEEALGLPVLVANRSKVGALAELWGHKGRSRRTLIYVSLGTGVAAGIVIGGELFIGANSSAGELGHISVVPDGPVCGCGNRGCLQTLVSEEALLRRARSLENAMRTPIVADVSELFSRALNGTQPERRVMEEAAEYLAVAIGTVVNLFNPEQLILGGPVVEGYPDLVAMVRERALLRSMHHPFEVVEIRASRLGPLSSPLGAAIMILKVFPRFVGEGTVRFR
ncbi:MAG: ROK family protein [Alkalispirochaetaceae bacterium]